MERLAPGRGDVGPAFWNSRGRARRYAAAVAATGGKDPFLTRLRRSVDRRSTVVDVGAGTGRIALALAPKAREVVAVDPSSAMLGILEREARRRDLANVRCIEGRWQDVELGSEGDAGVTDDSVPPADVLICSYVLTLVDDPRPFVERMDAACRGRAFLYVHGLGTDALLDPFWRHFHGRPRKPLPTYLDAAAIVREIGAEPDIEVVEQPAMARFTSLSQAVKAYRETFVLPDTPEVRTELRALLRPWLVEDDGMLRPPIRTVPAAIVSWEGSGGQR